MEDTAIDDWITFFRDAGIPPNVSASYACSFVQNRIHLNMAVELNRDLLKELGVTVIGDAIAILRHAKSFREQSIRQKILRSISFENNNQKPAGLNNKIMPAMDMASITPNLKRYESDHAVIPPRSNNSDVTVIPGDSLNGNNQEISEVRQQIRQAPTQSSLQSHERCTNQFCTNASSQAKHIGENNVPVCPSYRELQTSPQQYKFRETLIPAVRQSNITEHAKASHVAPGNQSNHQTSHSEHLLGRESVEYSSTLPSKQAHVAPSHDLVNNFMYSRNRGLKRPAEQELYVTHQQPGSRLLSGKHTSETVSQSSIAEHSESYVEQDALFAVPTTPKTKRCRTLMEDRSQEQEQIEQKVHTPAVIENSKKCVCNNGRISTACMEKSQVHDTLQSDVDLPKLSVSDDLKQDVDIHRGLAEKQPGLRQQCQIPSQKRLQRREVSQLQVHATSPSGAQPQFEIMSGSPSPSVMSSESQQSCQRPSQTNVQFQSSLQLDHESQSSLQSLPQRPGPFKSNIPRNLQPQKQEVIVPNIPSRLCSSGRVIPQAERRLKIKKKIKLQRGQPIAKRLKSASLLSQSAQHPHEGGLQGCGNLVDFQGQSAGTGKKKFESRMNKEAVRGKLDTSEFLTETDDADDGLLEGKKRLNLTTQRCEVSWDECQESKSVLNTSACGHMYADESSHRFNNLREQEVLPGHQAEFSLQPERVPGQIFSRLGMKIEAESSDKSSGNVSDIFSSRLGNIVKHEKKKAKNDKCSFNKIVETKNGRQYQQNSILKRIIVFNPQQKAAPAQRQNSIAGNTSQQRPLKLRSILKPQTITSEYQEDTEPEEDIESQEVTELQEDTELQESALPQRMTANLLLESVATTGNLNIVPELKDAVYLEETSLNNHFEISEEEDHIYQNSDICSDIDEEHIVVPVNGAGTSKTVHFGPVCVKEFQKNFPPSLSSANVMKNSTSPVSCRLGSRWKRMQ